MKGAGTTCTAMLGRFRRILYLSALRRPLSRHTPHSSLVLTLMHAPYLRPLPPLWRLLRATPQASANTHPIRLGPSSWTLCSISSALCSRALILLSCSHTALDEGAALPSTFAPLHPWRHSTRSTLLPGAGSYQEQALTRSRLLPGARSYQEHAFIASFGCTPRTVRHVPSAHCIW